MSAITRTAAALALLVPGAVLLPSAPAWAHNSLAESSPAAGATLTSPPHQVRLRFLQRLSPSATTIALTDAAKRRVPTGAPVIRGATGTVAITRRLTGGAYTVAYRVASTDGHVVRGSYSFRVA